MHIFMNTFGNQSINWNANNHWYTIMPLWQFHINWMSLNRS